MKKSELAISEIKYTKIDEGVKGIVFLGSLSSQVKDGARPLSFEAERWQFLSPWSCNSMQMN